MRAWELYETDKRMLGIYDPALDTLRQNHLGDTNKPRITLGYRPPAPETIVPMDQRPVMH